MKRASAAVPRRTSDGASPNCRRNARLKYDTSPKPQSKATALIF
jgi:hypothetical protein